MLQDHQSQQAAYYAFNAEYKFIKIIAMTDKLGATTITQHVHCGQHMVAYPIVIRPH